MFIVMVVCNGSVSVMARSFTLGWCVPAISLVFKVWIKFWAWFSARSFVLFVCLDTLEEKCLNVMFLSAVFAGRKNYVWTGAIPQLLYQQFQVVLHLVCRRRKCAEPQGPQQPVSVSAQAPLCLLNCDNYCLHTVTSWRECLLSFCEAATGLQAASVVSEQATCWNTTAQHRTWTKHPVGFKHSLSMDTK